MDTYKNHLNDTEVLLIWQQEQNGMYKITEAAEPKKSAWGIFLQFSYFLMRKNVRRSRYDVKRRGCFLQFIVLVL